MYRSSLLYLYFQANTAVSDAENESGLLIRRSAAFSHLMFVERLSSVFALGAAVHAWDNQYR